MDIIQDKLTGFFCDRWINGMKIELKWAFKKEKYVIFLFSLFLLLMRIYYLEEAITFADSERQRTQRK
jgi:hypothetical protein